MSVVKHTRQTCHSTSLVKQNRVIKEGHPKHTQNNATQQYNTACAQMHNNKAENHQNSKFAHGRVLSIKNLRRL